MNEAGVLAEMEIEVVERIGLQDQCGKVARSLDRQQVADQVEKFLGLKIDGVEVQQVRRRNCTQIFYFSCGARPQRQEVGTSVNEVDGAHVLWFVK